VIDPADWNFDYARQVFKTRLVPGFQIRWQVVPRFVDSLEVPPGTDAAMETVVTVANGLPGGKHRLELRGPGKESVQAVRAYRPLRAGTD